MPYAGEDVLQLGGDFILDRHRRVVFAYSSANPTDRPAMAVIRGALPSVLPMSRNTASDDPHVDPIAQRD
jgi:hypothetical protein